MSHDDKTEKVAVPQGVSVSITNDIVTAKGPKGEVSMKFLSKRIDTSVEGGHVILKKTSSKISKKDKMFMNTYRAHMRNLLHGAAEGFVYKLKICSGHFPMNVTIKGNILQVKNFIGEAVPRRLVIKEGVTASIDGDMIIIEGASKELVGTVAGDIEQLMRITNRDRRIFQDGIYIVEKNGKVM